MSNSHVRHIGVVSAVPSRKAVRTRPVRLDGAREMDNAAQVAVRGRSACPCPRVIEEGRDVAFA